MGGDVAMQRFLVDPQHEDRLLMPHQPCAGDGAVAGKTDRQIDRLAGIAERPDHGVAEEDIADRNATVEHGGGRRIAFDRARALGAGKDFA